MCVRCLQWLQQAQASLRVTVTLPACMWALARHPQFRAGAPYFVQLAS